MELKIRMICLLNYVVLTFSYRTSPVLYRFHDGGRQSWAMCKVMVIAYNPSEILKSMVKIDKVCQTLLQYEQYSAIGWKNKLKVVHIFEAIQLFDNIFHPFLEGWGV